MSEKEYNDFRKGEHEEVETETPNIQSWYDGGMGYATIKNKLIEEYGYDEDEARKMINEVIYGE